MPIDDFNSVQPNISMNAPFSRGESVTPSDTVDLVRVSRALWIGVTGHVTYISAGGDTVTLSNVPVGVLNVRASRVKATGTTATNIAALS